MLFECFFCFRKEQIKIFFEFCLPNFATIYQISPLYSTFNQFLRACIAKILNSEKDARNL